MSADLPGDLQKSYDALKYLAESTLTKADAEDFIADLEVLTAPLRASQQMVAGVQGQTFRVAWDLRKAADHPGTARIGDQIINPPTLLDLVLKAQKLQEGS